MQSRTLHTHIGKDGILKLEMPVGIANADLEIILILNPVKSTGRSSDWNPVFFTEVIGGWQGAPFVREPQGMYETRGEFK